MAKEGRSTWRRTFNRYIGLATAVVGVTIVLSSFVFLSEFFYWYLTVALGLLVALLGFLYGVNPFFTNERRYLALRKELDDFIRLVHRLNTAAITPDSEEEFEVLKAAMHDSVDQMGEYAGAVGPALVASAEPLTAPNLELAG
ncbi:MAG: hypothetical protein V3U13_04415 [Gemmatimonadota bacterium]